MDEIASPCPTCGHITLPSLDWPEFGARLRMAMARANMSYRQTAAASGVDQATLHRVAKHGKPPSADNYILMARWLLSQKETPHGRD